MNDHDCPLYIRVNGRWELYRRELWEQPPESED